MTPPRRRPVESRLNARQVHELLAVTRALATPFDLHAMLAEVTTAARHVLRAERASVWLLDAERHELVVQTSSDLGVIRVPADAGLVGACAATRAPVNVRDCYADPRFNPAVDRATGFVTRCSLSLPLEDHRGALVGVMQLLNRQGGAFDDGDVELAQALAAQCAVALSRVQMGRALLDAELLRQEAELASQVQRRTLPARTPELPGYEMHAEFVPASQTGGDTYDLAHLGPELLVVLADAAGHGMGPAMTVTQMHAMLRVALRLGADLATAYRQVNDELAERLGDGSFVTAFVGLLDPAAHRLRFISGGQGPIVHLAGDSGRATLHRATMFPMGAMPIVRLREPVELALAAGDWLLLISDGVFEAPDADGTPFGVERALACIGALRHEAPADAARALLTALALHRGGQAQHDDVTVVLLKRTAAA